MAERILSGKIKQLIYTTEELSQSPLSTTVIDNGVLVYEKTSSGQIKCKMGDGNNVWSGLNYIEDSDKMDKTNPTGTGSFSMNRLEGSTIGSKSHAEGYDTTASGEASHAEGRGTTASGYASHAEGYYNLSGGYTKFDAALGSETVDSTINYYIDVANLDTTLISTNDEIYALVEDNASAEKQICKIIVSSITEYSTTDEVSTVKHKIYFDENELKNQMSGFPNIKIINIYVKNNNNPYSTHAEGYYTTASGDYGSHAEGYYTTASGDYGSHAEGEYATASGYVSHAEGYYTTASGDSSHAEGDYATASGEDSHAEGGYTTASGKYAHAEGYKTTASGYASHAEGEYTKASGKYTHAEGYHTTARTNSQHVQGKYNIEDKTNTYAHIVGGGTGNSNRKNIHTLDWNGNAVFSGDVTATDSNGNTVSLINHTHDMSGLITYGTTDLIAGTSELANGTLYIYYEDTSGQTIGTLTIVDNKIGVASAYFCSISVTEPLTEGNHYRYITENSSNVTVPTYQQDLSSWSTWDGTSYIYMGGTINMALIIAECNTNNKALKYGTIQNPHVSGSREPSKT